MKPTVKHSATPTASFKRKPTIDTEQVTVTTTTVTMPNKSVFDELPDSAFVRESQLVQSPKRPNSTAPLPFSAPTLWRKVKAGTFPAPVKLSERVTAWNLGTVRAWMTAQATA
jgi:predicted DNA-binding transcriptional regulator AlpA